MLSLVWHTLTARRDDVRARLQAMQDTQDKLLRQIGRFSVGQLDMEIKMSEMSDKISALTAEVQRARGVEASAKKLIAGFAQIVSDAVAKAVDAGVSKDDLAAIDEAVKSLHDGSDDLSAAVVAVPSPDGTIPSPPPPSQVQAADPAPDHRLDPFDPAKDRPVQAADEPMGSNANPPAPATTSDGVTADPSPGGTGPGASGSAADPNAKSAP